MKVHGNKIIALILILIPCILKGQFGYNTHIVPLGEKEALMANTGIAGVNSVGAILYNPGALTQVKGNSISFSGSAFSFYSIEVDPIINIAGTPLRYSAKGFKSIPSSIFMQKTIKDWKLGFSVVMPLSFEVEGPKTWTIPVGNDEINILIDQLYKEEQIRIGLTAARKIGKNYSIGITAYGESYTSLNKGLSRINLLSDPTITNLEEKREYLSAQNLILILGIHKSFEHSSIGFSTQFPEIKIRGRSDYFDTKFNNFDATSAEEINIINADGKFKTPLQLKVGYAKNWSTETQSSIDLSYTKATEYNAIETKFYTKEVKREESYRLSMGQKLMLKENLTGMMGLAYTPSMDNKDEYDFYSITGGLELRIGNVNSIIGLFYSRAEGNIKSPENPDKSVEIYQYRGLYLGTNYTF